MSRIGHWDQLSDRLLNDRLNDRLHYRWLDPGLVGVIIVRNNSAVDVIIGKRVHDVGDCLQEMVISGEREGLIYIWARFSALAPLWEACQIVICQH